MSNTTVDNIKKIAPELSDFIDANTEIIELILADVVEQITATVYGTKQEQAQRYLGAHLLTLINAGNVGISSGAAGPVAEEKVGDVRIRYASGAFSKFSDFNRYDETKYGRMYMVLRRGRVFAFRVITP